MTARADLRTMILGWITRASLRVPVSPTWDPTTAFAALAEQDINEKLRARCMITRVAANIDGQYLTLPCDYLEAADLRLGNGGPELLYASRADTARMVFQHTTQAPGDPAWGGYTPDFYPIMNSNPWNNGQPQFYSVIGQQAEFVPFPAPDPSTGALNVFPLEIAYFQRQTLGPDDADTTPVLSTYPAIYLYGCLLQAAPFLREDPRVPTWGQFYQNAISGANQEYERSRTQGSRLVQRYRRVG